MTANTGVVVVKPVVTALDSAAYEKVTKESPAGLLYGSLRYRAFLERILENCEAHYYVAYENDVAVGALPLFRTRGVTGGDIVNSLPFFGSHGGPLVTQDAQAPDAVREALLRRWTEHATEQGVRAATLITNPLDTASAEAASRLPRDFEDTRIGQLTELPSGEGDVGAALMALFHQKTRNAVRKAEKSGIQITHSGSEDALRALVAIHTENMQEIGGTPKPWSVFAALAESFRYDEDYRVYVATLDGSIIAALLVLYHGQAAEYFTPATVADARGSQPMSLLIFEAMKEAAQRGYRYWNWGGTWVSQTGVYMFKSRWGTTDLGYSYYTVVNDRSLLNETPASLLEKYPYFYAVPFSSLTP